MKVTLKFTLRDSDIGSSGPQNAAHVLSFITDAQTPHTFLFARNSPESLCIFPAAYGAIHLPTCHTDSVPRPELPNLALELGQAAAGSAGPRGGGDVDVVEAHIERLREVCEAGEAARSARVLGPGARDARRAVVDLKGDVGGGVVVGFQADVLSREVMAYVGVFGAGKCKV